MKPKSKILSFFNALFLDFRHLGIIQKIEGVVYKMGPSEKIIFSIVSSVVIISGLVLFIEVHNSFLKEVPSFGGSFTEGVIGSPRFINPILAISDTDKDMESLVYSGLLRSTTDLDYVGDLASSFEIKEEGKVYNLVIKENAYFHDNTKVTADDIIFTFEKIMDPVIKSPKRAMWEGVQVEKVNELEVKITLAKPYTPFIEALTIGILPKHLWQGVSSEEFPFSRLNINPIGSGPYKIENVSTNGSGIPNAITLTTFKKYVQGQPKIKSIVFKFFQNEDAMIKAYEDGSVENMVIRQSAGQEFVNKLVSTHDSIKIASLPRVFGVFLNQNLAPVFINKEIREALEKSAPKQKIVNEVLYGFGNVLNGPTPSYTIDNKMDEPINTETIKESLLNTGWKLNDNGILEKKTKSGTVIFSFSISTLNDPELKKTAEILKEAWEALGASVEIKIFDASDLSQNIIKNRKYDALLFGEVVYNNSDLYPFWHSSNRNDPGLNVSLYTNIAVDKALIDMQTSTDKGANLIKKEFIVSEIKNDIPAIFLFSPNLIYINKGNIKNITMKNISSHSERFINIKDWYIETEKIWNFFVNN